MPGFGSVWYNILCVCVCVCVYMCVCACMLRERERRNIAIVHTKHLIQ